MSKIKKIYYPHEAAVLEGTGDVGSQEECTQNGCSLKLCIKTFVVQAS